MNSKAICLLSGGLDSTTVLAVARSLNFDCYALSFDYGQRHIVELQAAARVAKSPYDKRLLFMRKLSWGCLRPASIADFSSDVEIHTLASLS